MLIQRIEFAVGHRFELNWIPIIINLYFELPPRTQSHLLFVLVMCAPLRCSHELKYAFMSHEHYLAIVMLPISYVVPHKGLHTLGTDVRVESGLEPVGELLDDGFQQEFLKVEIVMCSLGFDYVLLQVLLQSVHEPILGRLWSSHVRPSIKKWEMLFELCHDLLVV